MNTRGPQISTVERYRRELAGKILKTPVIVCPWAESLLGNGSEVRGKLEFLQKTGTFKARGALVNLDRLGEEERARGVTAVSAGNHAVAVAYAAQAFATSAKVVMLERSNPARVEACKALGAEVVLEKDVHAAFERVRQIESDENRAFVHPFEGEGVAIGTGMVGLEMTEQWPEMNALIVPVGGGGLISGIANAVKQINPDCEIIGVEPTGADSMSRSFASGKPESLASVDTIADSLGAPFAMPYSFELAKTHVDRMITIEDREMASTMALLFREMKVVVEPACAAATAALLGPLRKELQGCNIMLTFCGSNIDWNTWQALADFDD